LENYEILIVDDRSTDETQNILKRFQTNTTIRVLHHPQNSRYKSSKKAALEYAITHARGEVLVFTDADCYPGSGWLNGMASHFTQSIGLVAGFSPQRARSRLLDRILIIDAASAALVSSSSIQRGLGVTCAGRNLAYRKSAFEDIGGFGAVPDTLSGDDDFILQKIAQHPNWNVTYAFDPKTVVQADGPQTWFAFLRQKRRHLSAGVNYRPRIQFYYTLFHTLNAFVWTLSLLGMFQNILFCLPLFAKIVVDLRLLILFLVRFGFRLSWIYYLIWEGVFVFYHTLIGPLGVFKVKRW